LLGKIAKKIHHCYKINNNHFILLAAKASLMQINLFESIRIFIEIVESGSLTQAAENLQVHRPAVTKALQLLEQHSGTRLLQRTTRRISLTPDGEAFYRRSKPCWRRRTNYWSRLVRIGQYTASCVWICPSLLPRCG
jgi:DNA-binding transcriptional LysR family regulator